MTEISDTGCLLLQNLFLSFLLFATIHDVAIAGNDTGKFYDFIVVGAGAAGCVVARRLSEYYTVLLLEAGGEPDPDLEIPALALKAYFNGDIKFYASLPEQNVGQSTNGTIMYPVGRVVGGGTAVNAMMFNRGSPYDYDNWANITGDPSWSYRKMLKYFKRIEDYHGIYPAREYHGMGGPITVSKPNYAPGLDTWLKGSSVLGYPNSDPNGRQIPSFTPIEFNKLHGRRVSSYRGYIKPILGINPNLTLIKNAKATKIYFKLNKAVAVQHVTKDGHTFVANILKEVVVSAGVIESPVLLLKSGIGLAKDLKQLDVSEVKFLPVGRHLHDQPSLFLNFLVKRRKVDIFDVEKDLSRDNFVIFEETGDGPFSCFSGQTAQAFLVSSVRAREQFPNPEWPDVQLLPMQMSTLFPIEENAAPDDVEISTIIVLTRPKSQRGVVTLNETNADAEPVVAFNYLTHPDDMEAMINAVEQTISLYENVNSPYREQDVRVAGPLKFCKHLKFRSKEYWKCYIRYMTFPGAHGVGTNRMGKGHGDRNAVVDNKLKVIGIENVRVADASIMPSVTNANTMVPSMVIGEKAAAMILEEWGQQSISNGSNRLKKQKPTK